MEQDIIAVMGATGAGKSSLIKLLTERDDIEVGHGLTSGTLKWSVIRIQASCTDSHQRRKRSFPTTGHLRDVP